MQLKNNNPRGRRTSRRAVIERVIRLLEFFRENTDEKHPIGEKELRSSAEISEFMPSSVIFYETVREMCEALNCDENGTLRDKSEWRLLCKGFADYYGGDDPDDDSLNSARNIYYKHTFGESELDAMITALATSKFVDKGEAKKLTEKIKKHLASKYYKAPTYIPYTDEFTDTKALTENLRRIQKAISGDSKISLTFNYYNRAGVLEPNKSKRHTINPYYIISKNGAFYLLGLYDNGRLCFYRIDLMSDIHISGERLSKAGGRSFPQNENELPKFLASHAYMSFDNEIKTITLKALKAPSRVKNELRTTHLHNVFGEHFKALGGGRYSVECTEFDILEFAFRERDDFEVVEPSEIREKIKDKIREMAKRYDVN